MNQDKIEQLSKKSDGNPKLPPIQDNLDLPMNRSKINLRETEEQEVALTFPRRPQFRINENRRRRFD